MTAALAALLLALLASTPHLRDHPLGPAVRAEQLARMTVEAARLHRVPVPLFASLVLHESGYRSDVTSRTGAAGLAQLQPPLPAWKAWRADCARDAFACEQSNLREGARVLRRALNACRGDRACAVARYRGAPHVRMRDRQVVKASWRYAARMRE